MDYAILISDKLHFPVTSPEKFYNKLTLICEKMNQSLQDTLSDYYARHVGMIEFYKINGIGEDNDLIKAALEMNKYFEEWLND